MCSFQLKLWSDPATPGYHQAVASCLLPYSACYACAMPRYANQAPSNATSIQESFDLSVVDASPEETPEEEKYDDRSNAGNRTVLFE